MVVKEIKANYHSYLHEIMHVMDPVIVKMREQNGKPWRGQAWSGPFKQLLGYAKHLNVLKAVQWTTLPIIGPVAAGTAAGTYTALPVWAVIVGGLVLACLGYAAYVKWYEGKMATIGDARFHVEAFKAKRPTEYKIWDTYIQKQDFKFEGLYDLVNSLFGRTGDADKITHLVAYSQSQHDFMKSSMDDLRRTINAQEQAIESLEEELLLSENAVSYLVGIIKKINENLYRFVNGKFDLTDMDFITGFSLYRLVGTKLVPIMDKGTSGSYTGDIDIELLRNSNLAAVNAAHSDANMQAYMNTPYPGRYVVANKMKMLQGETWIWCFHVDDDDERALSLTINNDIIESKQIRRLIHACCLVLHKQMLAGKEVDLDAKAT